MPYSCYCTKSSKAALRDLRIYLWWTTWALRWWLRSWTIGWKKNNCKLFRVASILDWYRSFTFGSGRQLRRCQKAKRYLSFPSCMLLNTILLTWSTSQHTQSINFDAEDGKDRFGGKEHRGCGEEDIRWEKQGLSSRLVHCRPEENFG